MSVTDPQFILLHDQTPLSIVKLNKTIELPKTTSHLFNLSVAYDEISLVAPSQFCAPLTAAIIEQSDGWQAIKIDAKLDFSMVGVIASLSRPLADKGISIFVISTFNTDYLLIQEQHLGKTLSVLRQLGHDVRTAHAFN
jgi:hypothetical protein